MRCSVHNFFFSKKYTFFASRNSLRCGTAPVPRGIRAANRSGTGIDGVVAVTACGFSQMKTHTLFRGSPAAFGTITWRRHQVRRSAVYEASSLWLGSWKREHFSLPGGGFTASKGFHFYLENCRLEGWCLAGTDFATNLVMHMFSHKTMHSEK